MSPKNFAKTDPFVKKFLARTPATIAATFTPEQLVELKRVFKDRVDQHSVDIRISIPFLKQRCYLVFLLGKDQRLSQRVVDAGVKSPNIILLAILSLLLISALVGAMHTVKSGINSLPDKALPKSVQN